VLHVHRLRRILAGAGRSHEERLIVVHLRCLDEPRLRSAGRTRPAQLTYTRPAQLIQRAPQCIYALRLMKGEVGGSEGVEKIAQLRANSAFFRKRLKEMGCHVLGDDDSPIVPVSLPSEQQTDRQHTADALPAILRLTLHAREFLLTHVM
jgi:hypothetical protein